MTEYLEKIVYVPPSNNIPQGFGDVEVFGKLDCQTVPTRDTSVIRQADLAPYSQVKAHDQLTGLSNDDHSQYCLVNGRVGDVVKIPNTTASSSSTTGALVVSGGVGISGSLNSSATITGSHMTCSSAPVNSNDVVRLMTSPHSRQSNHIISYRVSRMMTTLNILL